MTDDATRAVLARIKELNESATAGPWCVWDGPRYTGGGRDLCIGAGEQWLANMDHRHCATIRKQTFEPDPCDGRDPDTLTCDICTIDASEITREQEATANFIAESRTLLPQLADICTAMAARIAELERNAKRYQYLRARVDGYDHPAQSITILFPWKTLTVGVPESLDAAIDTAMQEATHD